MKQIFPKEIIQNTVEVHRFKHRVSSKIIYGILLICIVCVCAVLPFVFLDIYSSGQGIIKAKKEKNQLSSLYSGKIKEIFITENKTIQKGDTLVIIDNTVVKDKLNLLSNQLTETKLFVHDLNHLSHSKNIAQDSLESFSYQKRYIQHAQKTRELRTRYTKIKRDFKRQEKLFKKNIIAKVEYQNSLYNLNIALSELNHFKKQQRNQWQSELTQRNNKLKELESTLLQYKEEQNNYIIRAPISGTIQNLIGIEVGNFIIAGSPLGEISPDTELIAECYIKPADIGLLKLETNVKLQVDAFNYNQWGMITGKIISISNDISFVNNTPMFKVICSLEQSQLRLKNGFQGTLKKGMTLNARFFIANRSAFDLLYDKVDDWFNPSTINNL
ncbi:MAG: HlyD family efflux transporter periplasmic adaptor subunit [Candidatus Lokiarchaeia archaeon]